MNVWGEQQLKQELELGPDGVVSLPLIGDANLGGFTLDEARVDLAQRLKAGYVDPIVTITLLEMRSHVVHVLGEVVRPGTVPYVRGATVLGALQAAGGFRPATANTGEVRVIRNRMAQPEGYAIDLDEVLTGAIQDMWLLPGDSVYVPPRALTKWSRWWRQAMPWGDGADEGR